MALIRTTSARWFQYGTVKYDSSNGLKTLFFIVHVVMFPKDADGMTDSVDLRLPCLYRPVCPSFPSF